MKGVFKNVIKKGVWKGGGKEKKRRKERGRGKERKGKEEKPRVIKIIPSRMGEEKLKEKGLDIWLEYPQLTSLTR